MAYSTFASSTKGNYTHRLQWELVSQNIGANTSLVNWRYTITRNVSSSNGAFWGDTRTFSATINGTNRNESKSHDFRSDATLTAVSRTGGNAWEISHNSDGTKNVSGSFNWSGSPFVSSGFPSASGSGTFTLPTIPRASSPTFSPSSVDAGSSVTINTNRASTGFTHDIYYTFGNSGQQLIASGVGASTSWTPPLSLLEQIPNSVSGTSTIRVVTKSGSSTIGERTANLSIRAGSTITPDFETVEHSEATVSPDVNALIGAYVQGVSRLNVEITDPDGIYGSTIPSGGYRIQVAGQTINAVSGVTATLGTSGSLNINGRVTDSRGRQFSQNVPITVMAYAVPVIGAFTVQRTNSGGTPDQNGDWLLINLTAATQSLIVGTQRNNLTWRVKTRQRGDTTPWSAITPDDGNTISAVGFNDDILIGTYPASQSFDVRVEVEDILGSVSAVESVLSTGGIQFHLSKDYDAVGIGKYHEMGSVDAFEGMYQRDGKRVLDEDDIAALLTPVGNVEWTARPTAPGGWLLCDGSAVSRSTYADLFDAIGTVYGTGNGSTTFNVPNLMGRVPVGRDAGQTEFDVLGETGGAKTHTLTVAQMPSHNHGGSTGTTTPQHDRSTSDGPNGSGRSRSGNNGTGRYTAELQGGAHNHSISSQGGGGAHNNLQPYLVLNAIIKA